MPTDVHLAVKNPLDEGDPLEPHERDVLFIGLLRLHIANLIGQLGHAERWKEICCAVGLQRSAAHRHWQCGISVIALTLNRRRFNHNLSKRRVIEPAGGA